MGLFDFVKSIGTKLFSHEDQAAKKIEEHIQADNPGIDDLNVSFKDGTAFLAGATSSLEALQKAILQAGNIEGVDSVNINAVKVSTNLSDPKEIESYDDTEYYVIVAGDTLSKISQRFYGSASKYPEIFEANREVIKSPDLIFPGQKIRIPHGRTKIKDGEHRTAQSSESFIAHQ